MVARADLGGKGGAASPTNSFHDNVIRAILILYGFLLIMQGAHPTNTTIRAEFFREDLPTTAREIFRLVILIYNLYLQIYAILVVAGSASRRFFPFPTQKIGLSKANIRGFRMVLDWGLA
jgi:hypothetical protein